MAKENSWGLHVEQFPQQELRHLPVLVKELLAGGVAGGLSKTCVAPLERVKILFQTGRMTNSSIAQTLFAIVREEGVQGWFRGNGASVLRIVPYAAFNFGAYEQYRSLLARYVYGSEAETHHIPPILDLLAGSAAGGTAVLMTYPLDLVRTRLAYGTERQRGTGSGSVRGATAGAGGQPGSAPSPVGSPPGRSQLQSQATSHRVAVSCDAKGHLARIASSHSAGPSGRLWQPSSASSLTSGSSCTSAQSLQHCSLQRQFSGTQAAQESAIKQTGQHRHAASMSKATIRSVLVDTVRAEGVTGLYRGINPTLLGILPYAGLKFYIYQSMKQYYWQLKRHPTAAGQHHNQNQNQRLPVWLMLSFGGVSGVVAQTITYPLDVVRRHMQVQGLRDDKFSQQKFLSTWHALTSITKQRGMKALFSGLSINYLKVVPSTAIGFTVYDAAKHYLDLPQNL